MFWNKIKSNEFTELLNLILTQSTRIASLELELQMYVRKLKASKGLKEPEPEPEPQKDLYAGMFLPQDVSNNSFSNKAGKK